MQGGECDLCADNMLYGLDHLYEKYPVAQYWVAHDVPRSFGQGITDIHHVCAGEVQDSLFWCQKLN